MPVLELHGRPETRRAWFAEVWAYREVLGMLVRKDFQTRYKRATLGLAWAVVVPVLQGAIMAVVFSRVVKTGGGGHFAIYVMGGVVAYAYFSTALAAATAAIVDGAGLTDKVWFPRAILAAVPCLSNLIGLAVTVVVLAIASLFFGIYPSARTLLLVPAMALLVALALALGLVLSALNVYFRDVKFLVQAALLVWLYVTPILYPQHLLHGLGPWLDANPLTGVVTVFHMATIGSGGPWVRPVLISIGVTIVLMIAGLEGQRRHDRLFVDLL